MEVTSIQDVLDIIKKESNSTTEQGRKFEKLMKRALEEDPSIAGAFDKVWLWKDWPAKDDTDTGVDLVARYKNTQGFVAIQCKCFDPKTYLKDISTFIAKANTSFKIDGKKHSFSKMILISTTDEISNHAQKTFSKQNIQASVLPLSELAQSKINWKDLLEDKQVILHAKKDINARKYQGQAIESCIEGFKDADRGKLIMACGTGKTFTSLKFTEAFNKRGDFVLFLVPSIALMSQTIREWLKEADKNLHTFAVCSDKTVGKKEDEDIKAYELPYLATTDLKTLKDQVTKSNETGATQNSLNIVFSTYQSIDIIIQAQKKNILPKFNLTICDEAHRTTGFCLDQKEQSHFTKVHHEVKSHKKLYMTATPRVYKVHDKNKVDVRGGNCYSMDDPKNYGEVFFKYGFSKAVKEGHLSDYKVMVLAVPDTAISKKLQSDLTNEERELQVSDEAKIIGCLEGLKMKTIDSTGQIKQEQNKAMQRAVAFCGKIKDSKRLAERFKEATENNEDLKLNTDHIDGSMNAGERGKKIDWLKANPPQNECRILFNAKCLSEGVDVPALDSVIFISPKNSEIDVVQSVGRVMRTSKGKQYGYVIIPVVIPQDEKPSEALKDNKRYKVIWQVVQALRSHDDRLKHEINTIEFNNGKPSSKSPFIMFPVNPDGETDPLDNPQLNFQFKEWEGAIYAKLVEKCGDRMYWDEWAKDVTEVAQAHIKTLNKLLKTDPKRAKQFKEFTEGLQKVVNPSITQEDAIEMVSQHIITKPIFEALFPHSKSIKENPISRGLEKILKDLEGEIQQDVKSLNKIYYAIKEKAQGINTYEGKQEIIKELYSKFFEKAFPKKSDKLGIVYTPLEVVDFMIDSIEHILNKEFNESLNDEHINILDGFTGTGTFITRLLQSGFIKKENLIKKYEEGIFANEILLLAHYISQVNIEETFHQATGLEKPFQGGTLTDTFQMHEDSQSNSQSSTLFPITQQKIEKQKQTHFKVILGNPPYSANQKSENDKNKNIFYPKLQQRITDTYKKHSLSDQGKSLHDSYLKAIRLMSDNLKEGVISFITNGSFLDGRSLSGVRKCLEKEFDQIYIYNLKGNKRGKGKIPQMQGDQLFKECQGLVSIFFLIKNPQLKKEKAQIKYYEVPNYLSRKEKLNLLKQHQSIESIQFQTITPDKHGDWLNQRDNSFYEFLEIANNKDKTKNTLFDFQSSGVCTNRDSWAYNFSIKNLLKNMKKTISYYNNELKTKKHQIDKLHIKINELKKHGIIKDQTKFKLKEIDKIISRDSKSIKWSPLLKRDYLLKNKRALFKESHIKRSSYRPFQKKYLYFDKMWINMIGDNQKIWFTPKGENIENKVICVSGKGAKSFSVLITSYIPNLHYMDTGQSFPQHYFDKKDKLQHGISDFALKSFKDHYNQSLTKDDLFYYTYGILNSKEYQEQFKYALIKELPHIPFAPSFDAFKEFVKKGKQLADLHLNYENHQPLKEIKVLKNDKSIALHNLKKEECHFEKIRFASKQDKSIIHFNSSISITNIPQKAYNYMIGEWSAIEHVISNYEYMIGSKKDKSSGIIQDPNLFSEEEGGLYVLKLLLSVITLSVKSLEIIESLPSLNLSKKEEEFNLEDVILKTLMFAMISDNKIKEVEKVSIIKGYKEITGYTLYKEEVESQLQAFIHKDWSEKSLLEQVKSHLSKRNDKEKTKIYNQTIKVIEADKEITTKEDEFLKNLSKALNYSLQASKKTAPKDPSKAS